LDVLPDVPTVADFVPGQRLCGHRRAQGHCGSPAEFGTILTEAVAKWAKVIKFAGIKVE
jgi:hypothetical protein